ncbi:hypothetical protein, partial [Pseudovibrio brasiliensis]|uniref:hypothetical protein n=1 Tax=Pseudovibrio brasiliensis TaxID=1898042 RepID=UPI001AD91FFD
IFRRDRMVWEEGPKPEGHQAVVFTGQSGECQRQRAFAFGETRCEGSFVFPGNWPSCLSG